MENCLYHKQKTMLAKKYVAWSLSKKKKRKKQRNDSS